MNKIEWREVELKEVAEIVSGSTPSTIKQEYWNGDINWITPAEIIDGNNWYYYETRKKITKKGLDSASINLFPKGTVMLTSRAPIGKVAIAGKEMCSNQGFKNFICDSKQLNNEYLYFWLRLKKDYLNSIGNGATFKEISKSIVSKIKIPLPFSDGKPNLKEQERIVKILEKAEKLKERGKKAKYLLDEYLKSVFYEMFLKDEGRLEIKKLVEVTQKITDGKHGDCEDLEQSGYYFISAKDIINGKISYENARQIKKEGYSEVNKRVNLELNDILITNSGTIGRIAIVDNKDKVNRTTFQKSVAVIKLNKDLLTPTFVRYFLETTKERLMRTSSGSSQKNLLLKDIRNIQIPIPSISYQHKFAKIVEQIEKMKENMGKTNKDSEELFDSLIQKSFRGEL